MTTDTTPQLYCAWFCPFAQRAWIALEHKGVKYDYVEQDPYNKTPEWLAINPRGLVPAIIYKGKVVYESSVCIEYVDELYPTEDPSKSLLPKDPFERAYARMWSDIITKKIVTFYYRLLMNQVPAEQQKLKEDILKNMRDVQSAMSTEGPFFQGANFGMVDIMLAPYAQRFSNVMKHFRDFDIPANPEFQRYHDWWRAVQQVRSFQATVQPSDKLIESYDRYATGRAKTQVADAVRQGLQLP